MSDQTKNGPENDFRGRVSLTLDGEAYPLRLSLDTIRRAERVTGGSWQQFITRAFEGSLRADDYAAVIWAGMLGANEGQEVLPLERIGELLIEEGMFNVNPAIRELLYLQGIGTKHEEDFLKRAGGDEAKESTGIG